jgi:hypothetical protein
LGVNGEEFMKYQRGFLDWALLEIAERTRWYIRYPVALCVLFAAWWLGQHIQPPDMFLLSWVWMILGGCAVFLAKEVSPSLLLMVAAMWVWPDGFFDIPFAQMTFGILCQFFFSVVLFASSPIVGLVIYSKLQYARYANEIIRKIT